MIRFERPFEKMNSFDEPIKPIDEFESISDVVLFGFINNLFHELFLHLIHQFPKFRMLERNQKDRKSAKEILEELNLMPIIFYNEK